MPKVSICIYTHIYTHTYLHIHMYTVRKRESFIDKAYEQILV